jgi:MFS family permease
MSLGATFNRLWAASIITNLADGLALTALPLLAISLTRDPVLISITPALFMLPWLLFAVPIGSIVDSINRKYALAGANATRALIAAVLSLTIVLHVITIYWLFLIIFLIGICEVFADIASQTVLPSIVDDEKLEVANSRIEMTQTVLQNFIGVPLGGLVYAIAIAAPFIANSLGLAVAALLCLSLPLHFVKSERESGKTGFSGLREDMKFGIKYLFDNRDLRRLVVATSLIGVGFSMATSTQVLFLVETLHLNPKHFGLVLSAMGVTSLLGAWLAPQSALKLGRGTTMMLAITVCSLATLLSAFLPNYWLFIAVGAIESFAIIHWNILLMSTYQRIIPQEIYGRIHGTRRTLVWGSMPIASLIGGFLAKIDLRLPWIIGGLIASAIAIVNRQFFISIADIATADSAQGEGN